MRLHDASERALLMDRYIALYLFSDAAEIRARRRGAVDSSNNGGGGVIGIQPPSSEDDDDGVVIHDNNAHQGSTFTIPFGHDVDIDYEVEDMYDSPPPPTDDATSDQPPSPTISGHTTPRIRGGTRRRGGPAIGWAELYDSDTCLLYTSDAADEEDSVDLGGRRIIKKKKHEGKNKLSRKDKRQRH
eukprot:TRINITY_DN18214_c0_g1_i2.p1 TRINITY_DN18214_c0_g1~~TRINITY_DN18214_c0_g1_i2.p1  ORF type:complete len:186 (-),score=33.84 TRINITY_DN18214_c0_g1_i2:25-582(-)